MLNVNGIFENRFDVILINPPFGSRVEKSLKITEADVFTDETKIKHYTQHYGEEYTRALEQVNGNKSIYPITKLRLCEFTVRRWRKNSDRFRYIEMRDIDPVFGITNDTNLSTGNAPSRATQIVKSVDLIIGTTRPYLKRFAIVPEKYDQYICSSAFQVIKPSEKYNIEFVYYFLQTKLTIIQYETYMTGALYPAINTSDLRQIKVPLPSLPIQNSIVRYANKKRQTVKSYILKSEKKCIDALKSFESQIFK